MNAQKTETYEDMFDLNQSKKDYTQIPISYDNDLSDIDKFLFPSKNKLEACINYLKEIIPQSERTSTPPLDADIQYFYDDKEYYPLIKKEVLLKLHEKISEMNNWASVEYCIKKNNNNMFDCLKYEEKTKNIKQFIITDIKAMSYNTILFTFNNEQLWDLSLSFINKMFLELLFEKHKVPDAFAKNAFCVNFGKFILNCYFRDVLLTYFDNKINKQNKKRIYKEIITNSNKDLLKDILKTDSLTLNDQELALLHFSFIYYIIKNNLYAKGDITEVEINNILSFVEQKNLNIFNYEIGYILAACLKNHHIITEDLRAHDGQPRVPVFLINKNLKNIIYTSAVFSKPHLSKEHYVNEVTFSRENVTLKLRNNHNKPITRSYNTKITESSKLLDSIKKTGEIPFSVNTENFDNLINFLRQFKSLIEDTTEEDKALIILFLYDIDIKKLLKNNTDLLAVREFITSALDINRNDDIETLKKKYKNNIALYQAYNTISATKFTLKGLFNDINIYKHFNYFYLPKYATSSGRLYTFSHFINIQGSKFNLVFLTFQKKQSNEDYLNLKNFVKEKYNIDLPRNRKEFDEANKKLYRSFIYDKLNTKDNMCLDNFPLNGTYKEQIKYVINICKKPKEILLVRTMIIAYLTKDFSTMFFSKDATSSGGQIISMLCRFETLAKLCNITGNTYNDIYKLFPPLLKRDFSIAENFLKDIFEKQLNIKLTTMLQYKQKIIRSSTEEFLYKKKIKQIKKANLTDDNRKNQIKNIKKPILPDIKLPVSDFFFEVIFARDSKDFQELFKRFTLLKKTDPKFFNILDKLENNMDIELRMTAWYPGKKKKTITKKVKPRTKIEFKNTMLLINKFFNVYLALSTIPEELLSDRSLHKKPVMTVAYGAGNKANLENYYKFFNEYYANQGFANVSSRILQDAPVYLNQFFMFYAKEYLTDMYAFLDLVQNYIENFCEENKEKNINIPIKSLKIVFPHYTWEFLEYAQKQTRIRALTNTHQRIFKENLNEYAKANMKTSLPSIFIQGIDSCIVRDSATEFDFFISQKFYTYFWTNHDCFAVSAEYAFLLDIIVRHVYNKVCTNTDFIKNFLSEKEFEQFLKEKPEPLSCTNPYFIKF